MRLFNIQTDEIKKAAPQLCAGDKVNLSGYAFTARDAAHKLICEMLKNGKKPPFEINGSVIYYAGPTEKPDNLPIGSCGPTTSGRMDAFSPYLLDLGLSAMIGKGARSKKVCEAICRNKAVYFAAVGGAGALAAACIKSLDVIAFSELGCESVKRLMFSNFPVIVAIDSRGGNLYKF